MKKGLTFIAAVAVTLAAVSCSKTIGEVIPTEQENETEYISIRLINEGEDITKAYYMEDPSYWTYLWEDEDTFNYFYYTGGEYQGVGTADVTKGENSTCVRYEASNLEVGNTIYTYFLQKDLWQNEVSNVDPSKVKLIIPVNQVTTKEPEKFRKLIECAFTLDKVSLKNQTAKGSINAEFHATIPDNTLYFTINGFNPSLKSFYKCKCDSDEGAVSDFTINDKGECSVVVSFDAYPSYTNDQATIVKVYLSGDYSGNSASIKVKAHRNGQSALTEEGRTSKYSCELCGNSTATCYETTYGAEIPYPIRDAMPCASRGKIITTSLLKYPEDIANSMTMYMLGSAAEFRIYSPSGKYQGESIQKVVVTRTNGNCSGYCYYDIESESLELTGFENNTVTSDVSSCGYLVPNEKGGEESVYMVLASGTYDATIDVVTKDSKNKMWNYHYVISNKEFTRANRKPFAVDLESKGATRTEL